MDDDSRRRVARSPLDRVLRYVGLIAGLLLGGQVGVWIAESRGGDNRGSLAVFMAAVVGGLLFIVTPYFTIGLYARLR
ncbi:MAG: PIN/TRAM domain-containing protein, partial [Vicinamibacterales bacterium]